MEADVQGAQGDRLEHKPQVCCVSHQQKQLRMRHLTIIVKMNRIKFVMTKKTKNEGTPGTGP